MLGPYAGFQRLWLLVLQLFAGPQSSLLSMPSMRRLYSVRQQRTSRVDAGSKIATKFFLGVQCVDPPVYDEAENCNTHH